MNTIQLTPEDLLAGAAVTYDIVVPPDLLQPGVNPTQAAQGILHLRPLSIGAFQLIMKAAKADSSLIPLLMIKEAVVQPTLSLDQIKRLHLGLVNFLINHIREISGLEQKKTLLTN